MIGFQLFSVWLQCVNICLRMTRWDEGGKQTEKEEQDKSMASPLIFYKWLTTECGAPKNTHDIYYCVTEDTD